MNCAEFRKELNEYFPEFEKDLGINGDGSEITDEILMRMYVATGCIPKPLYGETYNAVFSRLLKYMKKNKHMYDFWLL